MHGCQQGLKNNQNFPKNNGKMPIKNSELLAKYCWQSWLWSFSWINAWLVLQRFCHNSSITIPCPIVPAKWWISGRNCYLIIAMMMVSDPPLVFQRKQPSLLCYNRSQSVSPITSCHEAHDLPKRSQQHFLQHDKVKWLSVSFTIASNIRNRIVGLLSEDVDRRPR